MEGRARPLDTPHRDIAAHAASKVAADCQPKTGAFVRRSETTPDLHERLEDGVQTVGWDAAPRIADHNGIHCSIRRVCDAYRTASRREPDRVQEQVDEHLTCFLFVGPHGEPAHVPYVLPGFNIKFAQALEEPAFAAREVLAEKDARTLATEVLAMD
ncbi:MAG TPA: hypothetical protein VGT98_06955, partial [Candidatus Elarobacter sp.]|nr:hypothetical protein [Candidatus Elarobacter sp.]